MNVDVDFGNARKNRGVVLQRPTIIRKTDAERKAHERAMEYRNRLNAMSAERSSTMAALSSARAEVASLKAELETLKAEVASLKASNESLKTETQNLRWKAQKPWKNKRREVQREEPAVVDSPADGNCSVNGDVHYE